jgi:lipoyl(octanoyl) transferase
MNQICHVGWLGFMPYKEAWQLQNHLAGEIAEGKRPPTLLLLEHPHTYTFGRQGQAGNLLWGEAELERRGIAVHWVDRGGDVTYHGPGQLVGYPLLPLAPGGIKTTPYSGSPRMPQADFVGYLRKLEQVLIRALDKFGITGEQIPGLTGVWVAEQTASSATKRSTDPIQNRVKIAAIGVKVDVKGISRHGFALNVNPNMTYWEGIVGCGLEGYQETSLADLLNPPPSMAQVRDAVVSAFNDIFGYIMEWRDTV